MNKKTAKKTTKKKALTLEHVPEERAEVIPVDRSLVTPQSMLQAARAEGASIEQMAQLMEMSFKWDAEQARKAYHAAVADFKAAPLIITKDRENSQYKSRYTLF